MKHPNDISKFKSDIFSTKVSHFADLLKQKDKVGHGFPEDKPIELTDELSRNKVKSVRKAKVPRTPQESLDFIERKLLDLLKRDKFANIDYQTLDLWRNLEGRYASEMEQIAMTAIEKSLLLTLRIIHAWKFIKQAQYSAARNVITDILDMDIKNVYGHTLNGLVTAHDSDDYHASLESVEIALDVDANFRLAIYTKIFILLKMGKGGEAARLLEENLLKYPKDYDLLMLKVMMHVSLSNYPMAMQLIEEAIFIDSRRPEAYIERGIIDFLCGDIKRAEASFSRTIKLGSTSMSAYKYLATIYSKTHRIRDAYAMYKTLLIINPDDNESSQDYFTALYRNRDIKEALELCNYRLEGEPNNFFWIFSKGLCLEAERNYNEALTYFKEALKVAKDNADIVEHICTCYSILLQFKKGHEVVDKFLSEYPNSLTALLAKGRLYQFNEEFDKAEECYKYLLTNFTESLEPKFAMTSLFLSLGNFSKAQDYFSTFEKDTAPDSFTAIMAMSKTKKHLTKTHESNDEETEHDPIQELKEMVNNPTIEFMAAQEEINQARQEMLVKTKGTIEKMRKDGKHYEADIYEKLMTSDIFESLRSESTEDSRH